MPLPLKIFVAFFNIWSCLQRYVLLLNFPGLFNVTDVVWKDIYSDTRCVSSSLNIWYLQYLYNLSPPPHSTPTHQNITIYNKSTNGYHLIESISFNFCEFLKPFLRKLTIFRCFPIPKKTF